MPRLCRMVCAGREASLRLPSMRQYFSWFTSFQFNNAALHKAAEFFWGIGWAFLFAQNTGVVEKCIDRDTAYELICKELKLWLFHVLVEEKHNIGAQARKHFDLAGRDFFAARCYRVAHAHIPKLHDTFLRFPYIDFACTLDIRVSEVQAIKNAGAVDTFEVGVFCLPFRDGVSKEPAFDANECAHFVPDGDGDAVALAVVPHFKRALCGVADMIGIEHIVRPGMIVAQESLWDGAQRCIIR